jgi:hypothetical protein
MSRDDVAAEDDSSGLRVSALEVAVVDTANGLPQESQSCRIKDTGKEGTVMANKKMKKCAHIPCLCDIADGEEYCGETCRDAGSDDVEIACQCNHAACPLTFGWFASRNAANLAG